MITVSVEARPAQPMPNRDRPLPRRDVRLCARPFCAAPHSSPRCGRSPLCARVRHCECTTGRSAKQAQTMTAGKRVGHAVQVKASAAQCGDRAQRHCARPPPAHLARRAGTITALSWTVIRHPHPPQQIDDSPVALRRVARQILYPYPAPDQRRGTQKKGRRRVIALHPIVERTVALSARRCGNGDRRAVRRRWHNAPATAASCRCMDAPPTDRR